MEARLFEPAEKMQCSTENHARDACQRAELVLFGETKKFFRPIARRTTVPARQIEHVETAGRGDPMQNVFGLIAELEDPTERSAHLRMAKPVQRGNRGCRNLLELDLILNALVPVAETRHELQGFGEVVDCFMIGRVTAGAQPRLLPVANRILA